MDRKLSIIATKFKKKSLTIDDLPKDIITEIFAQVAGNSSRDFFNVKLSCKDFHEYVEDTHVYKHVSMDKIPIAHWKPLSENQQAFLSRCKECGNPEIMYRQAIVDYFTGRNMKSGIRRLRRAVDLGHKGALYAASIVLIFSGDSESKEKGVRLLRDEKKNRSFRRDLKMHRDHLIEMLRCIWLNNPRLRHRPGMCCTTQVGDGHRRRNNNNNNNNNGWTDEEEEDDDDDAIVCEACSVDVEVKMFSRVFPR